MEASTTLLVLALLFSILAEARETNGKSTVWHNLIAVVSAAASIALNVAKWLS